MPADSWDLTATQHVDEEATLEGHPPNPTSLYCQPRQYKQETVRSKTSGITDAITHTWEVLQADKGHPPT